ncbi:MAG: hypothetical protein ACR2KU_11130, partial [Gammaproteobacteria bacterium]
LTRFLVQHNRRRNAHRVPPGLHYMHQTEGNILVRLIVKHYTRTSRDEKEAGIGNRNADMKPD